MVEIIPALLVHDKKTFIAQTRAVEMLVSLVQIDIADGIFVPNTTWAEPKDVKESLQIDCELHLMVQDPLTEIRKWADEDVPQVKRVLIHYESDPEHISDILAQAHSYGWEVGLVINPPTPVSAIENLIEEVDTVMCMGVTPGKQGQPFVPEVLEKIRQLHEQHPSLPIAVDGHVDQETIPKLIQAGATRLGIGSAIYNESATPGENINHLKKIIEKLTETI